MRITMDFPDWVLSEAAETADLDISPGGAKRLARRMAEDIIDGFAEAYMDEAGFEAMLEDMGYLRAGTVD